MFQVGQVQAVNYLNFAKAAGRSTSRRRQLLLGAERDGDKDALKMLSSEECIQRRLIRSEADLETLDELSEEIPLWGQPDGDDGPK